MELPNRLTLREVFMEINGTIEGAADIAVENEGELYLWSFANTANDPQGVFRAINMSVRAGGKFEPLTAEGAPRLALHVQRMEVNAHGYVRANNLLMTTQNLTIDLSGKVLIIVMLVVSSLGEVQGTLSGSRHWRPVYVRTYLYLPVLTCTLL